MDAGDLDVPEMNMPETDAPEMDAGQLNVEVVRSARRRKTVQAWEVGGVLRVAIPARMSLAEEQHWVSEMTRRFERRRSSDHIDLRARVAALARRYELPHPLSVEWTDRQRSLWGSCTPALRSIRLSSRLAREPGWVLDYVIVHELAHLTEATHGEAFWALVNRYPRTERARGWLMAKGLEDGD
jgi:predicted metal-dependent hydrolase